MPRRDEPEDLPDDDDDDDRPRRRRPDDRPRRRPPRPQPAGGGVPTLVWVLVGGAALVVLGCAGAGALILVGVGEGVRKDAEEDRAAAKTEVIEAADLYADYKADGAKAASKYAGKVLRVRLTVDKATQSGNHLSIRQDVSRFDRVYADVPVKDSSRATVGTVVVVRGRVESSAGGDIRMGTCVLE